MARTFKGDVSFMLHDKLSPHRFEVSLTDENKIVIWIEDRQTKKQWHADALATIDFVTEENAIPKAKSCDYAERFAACLGSTDEGDNYGQALTTKGHDRVLILTLPFQWASQALALEYKFTLKEVPLERIDILGARVRDVEDKMISEERIRELENQNKTLKTQVEELSRQVVCSPVFAQATTNAQCSLNQNLIWIAHDSDADSAIEFLSTGHIRFSKAGVYAIDIGVIFVNSSTSFIFELKRAETTLAAGQGSSYSGYCTTTPLRYILKAKANDEICVVYVANGAAHPGSYIAITKL